MEQNKFTVDQVQDFVENGLDLDLKWEERLVYNPSSKRYTQAKMEHFDNNKTAYMRLKNTKNNKTYLAKHILFRSIIPRHSLKTSYTTRKFPHIVGSILSRH